MIAPNKRICTHDTQISTVAESNRGTTTNNVEPFSTLPFFVPNRNIQMLTKALLQYHIVSFLTFREQSNTMARISKAFNQLATFARDEQDWRDHQVYFNGPPEHINLSNPSQSIYNYFSPKPNYGFYFTEYFCWKLASNKNPTEDSSQIIDFSTISTKIQFIKKAWIGEQYNEKFSNLLKEKNQITTISAFINISVSSSESLFIKIAETCQNLTELHLKFNKSPLFFSKNSSHNISFGSVLLNCNQLEKLTFKVTDTGNLRYINTAIEESSLKDIPLKSLLLNASFVETSSLNTELSKLLQKSSQLTEITFINPQHNNQKWCIDSPLLTLAQCCPYLKSMYLGENVTVSDDTFTLLLSSCKHLKSTSQLSTEKNGLTIKTFTHLLQHPSIECIDISMHIPSSILRLDEEYKCPSLSRFTYDDYYSSMDTDPSVLFQACTMFFPNLTSLYIWTRERIINDYDIITLISNCPIITLNISFLDNNYFTENSLTALSESPKFKDAYFKLYYKSEELEKEKDKKTFSNSIPNSSESSNLFDTLHGPLIPLCERVNIQKSEELFKKRNKKLVLDPIAFIDD